MVATMRVLLALLTLLLITSCVTAPPARVAPAPSAPVTALPAPVPLASDWRDWPQTPGDWHYVTSNGRSFATFGTGDPGQLTLSCTADRTIRIARPVATRAAMTIHTTSITRVLATTPAGDPPAASVATIPATDPLLDAIGFSRGRFVVEQPGAQPLVLPAWAEVERVIEDCRD